METSRQTPTPALTIAQINALSKAMNLQGAARVRRVEYGVYEVPSATDAEITYTVKHGTEAGSYDCDCPAGRQHRPCWHVASVVIRKAADAERRSKDARKPQQAPAPQPAPTQAPAGPSVLAPVPTGARSGRRQVQLT